MDTQSERGHIPKTLLASRLVPKLPQPWLLSYTRTLSETVILERVAIYSFPSVTGRSVVSPIRRALVARVFEEGFVGTESTLNSPYL